MKNKFIPYGHQWIDRDDIKEVVKVLKADWLTQGPKIKEFEKAVAKYCGAKYAVAVSSGTAALHSAYSAAGIKSGDEIITTPLTFAATANMIVTCGAKPVFVDIESDTLNINPDLIEKKITKKTKAIVPVDFAGHPCDYNRIFKIAKENNLLLIEDACHALGSLYKGKKLGNIADITVFSFHPVKLITTGEGGMVLTNNKNFYEKLKIFRNHGMIKKPPSFTSAYAKAASFVEATTEAESEGGKATEGREKGAWYYEIENPSFNYRITDIQCALGVSQLKKIDRFIKRRREIVSFYNKAFKHIKEIIAPVEKDYVKSSSHIYPIQVQGVDRRKIFDALQKQGIGVQVHYMPLHLHPFYKNKFEYKAGDFPIAERYYQRAITLPLFPAMTEKNIKKVIETVKKIVNL